MKKRETAEIYLDGPFLGISLPEGTLGRIPCGFPSLVIDRDDES